VHGEAGGLPGSHIDGHAPLLSGHGLNAYLSCGIRNCHETTNLAEGREKLAKGMQVLMREGSVSKDLGRAGAAAQRLYLAVSWLVHG